ncbi:EndoU domain-containing protein [Streptococcus parasuis]|uniref:EndoU domain-containing protein n=1 Tax=Streptococcus parasuis TaxID=1501662 RepID=UPI002FC599A3
MLYGDKTGGGHLHPGQPGKSTFQSSWGPDQVMHNVSDVATDPKIEWKPGRVVKGIQRYEVTGIRDGVEIFVVTDGSDIIAAYPIGR